MKTKTLNILLIALAVAIVFYGIQLKFSENNSGEKIESPFIVELGKVNKIEIFIPDSGKIMIFTKQKGKWYIGKKATNKEFTEFLNKINSVKIKQVVSENKENHEQFEVTDTQGRSITFFIGKNQPVKFIFGKSSEFIGMYARLANGEIVYEIAEDLTYEFSKKETDWIK